MRQLRVLIFGCNAEKKKINSSSASFVLTLLLIHISTTQMEYCVKVLIDCKLLFKLGCFLIGFYINHRESTGKMKLFEIM
jgi:hypothetical protein